MDTGEKTDSLLVPSLQLGHSYASLGPPWGEGMVGAHVFTLKIKVKKNEISTGSPRLLLCLRKWRRKRGGGHVLREKGGPQRGLVPHMPTSKGNGLALCGSRGRTRETVQVNLGNLSNRMSKHR